MMNALKNYTLLDTFYATGPAAPLFTLVSIAYVVVALFRLRKRPKNPTSVALILLTFLPIVIGIWGTVAGMQKMLFVESLHNNEGVWQLNTIESLLPLRFGSLLTIVFLVAALLIYAINLRQQARQADAQSEM